MLRWLALLLLVLNGVLFLWGRVNDGPLEPPLPPPPTAPQTLRLVGEPVPERPYSVSPVGGASDLAGREGEALERPASPARIRVSPSADVTRLPLPDFDGDTSHSFPGVGLPEPGLPERGLRETTVERVNPGLMPEALDPLPVVIPPVQEDEPGPVHQWRQEQGGYGD